MSPRILAFDTSGPWCDVAVLQNGTISAACHCEMARGQAESLMGLLEDRLKEANLEWADLDAIGVGVGPGNFTGIRIAVSTARGLGLGLGKPVYGVNGFDARCGLQSRTSVTIPAPQNKVYALTDAGPVLRPAEDGDNPDGSGRGLSEAIAQIAARRWPEAALPPAPLYIKPADAAPPRDAPPRILDDA